MSTPIKSPKKLIEVALPLDAINAASAKEKSIRHGHPSTLHLWWARRPLAAARAVIFAQMVNDPGGERGYFAGMTKAQAAAKREELFKIIEDLVHWENIADESVLERARDAIQESWRETCRLNRNHPRARELFDPEKPPALHDPFAGGGAIPLEAQRLGLDAFASDLNPVAVTINKAMIEVPHRFAGTNPVAQPRDHERQVEIPGDWSGARGLAIDVRRYGEQLWSEAEKRIGHLYRPVLVTSEMAKTRPDLGQYVGQELTVMAWIWARTVKSPNPAFSHVSVPLASTFVLSRKEGRESYIEAVIEGDKYGFQVRVGELTDVAEAGTKAKGRGANFRCLLSGAPISGDHVKAEGLAGRMGQRLMAVVAEGERGRVYLTPDEVQEANGVEVTPEWKPELQISGSTQYLGVWPYGMRRFDQLFTPRQLVALSTFSSLIEGVVEGVHADAKAAGMSNDSSSLAEGGNGALAYAQAIGLYLSLAVGKFADNASTVCSWHNGAEHQKIRATFGRQAIPMTWDYAEGNPFSVSTGNFFRQVELISTVIGKALVVGQKTGTAVQADAQTQKITADKVVSCDPPYFDNIPYADLSDFFYVWLRRSLRSTYPELYATVAVPKAEELVAAPHRQGGKAEAEAFFLNGMTTAMHNLAQMAHPAFPVTIYYAFKQSDTKSDAGTHSSGWETFLEAVLKAGFAITGTWPMRTELGNRMRGSDSNALASSIVLVCRTRSIESASVSRREFLRELNTVLPDALMDMTRGGVNSPVAPVDLSQAIIGPGMAIFSQYTAVLEADGKPMTVKTALQLINRFLAEDDFDPDTQFCLHWFETGGWTVGKYGDAEVLARAKGTSVGGLSSAGVLESSAGQARLLRWGEYPTDWSPETDQRLGVWEMLHQLIRTLKVDGEAAAGLLLARMPEKAEPVRALAYRLYTLCERKGWAEDARAYNELITSWTGIETAANEAGPRGTQTKLDI